MKLLFLSLFVLASLVTNAKCASSGVWCWPSTKTIKSNGILMIEFFGYSQLVADGLNTKYPVYLKGGGEKIKLLVTETLKGEFELTQVITKPEKELQGGVSYELVIDELPKEHQNIGEWSSGAGKRVPFSWTALAEKDIVAPSWQAQPAYVSKSFTLFGCGPAQFINYKLAVHDASEVLVKTTVTSLTTGKSSSYYLATQDGKLAVGHGMCSGAFRFQDGKEFEAVFALIDASGNTFSENTASHRFTKPDEKDWAQTRG